MKKIIKTLETSTIALLMLALVFVILEPAISNAVDSQFTQTLTITSEISFLTPASNITLTPAIAGLTGGTANGQTQVRVLTNNASGYNMTIKASSSAGMIGNTSALGGIIPAYVTSVNGVPDYSFTVAANKAEFGYTVEASTTGDLTPAFKDNGSTCGVGAADAVDKCWIAATTTPVQIINRNTFTADSGSTSTIKFRVVVNSNPSPAIPQDTYVATTTLTAVINP